MSELSRTSATKRKFLQCFTDTIKSKNNKKQQKTKYKTVKKVAKKGKKHFFFSYYGNFSLISFGY